MELKDMSCYGERSPFQNHTKKTPSELRIGVQSQELKLQIRIKYRWDYQGMLLESTPLFQKVAG